MTTGRKRARPGPWEPGWWEQSERSRGVLTREQLVHHALSLLDEVGFAGVTMRRLAERAGVKAASLYNHIRDKDELLAMVADSLCARIPLPDSAEPWRRQLETLARECRRVLLVHRDSARVLAATPPLGLHRLRLIEAVLEALCSAGLTETAVTEAAFAFNSYVVGFVLDETHPAELDEEADLETVREQLLSAFRALPRERFPRLIALAAELTAYDTERAFELGLACLLDGLEIRSAGSFHSSEEAQP